MGDKSAIEWTDATWNPTWDGAIPMIGRLAPATCSALAADLPAHAADYAWPVTRVIDGDTVAMDASADMPLELSDLKMQLRGVDTPEKGGRAKCDAERAVGRTYCGGPGARRPLAWGHADRSESWAGLRRRPARRVVSEPVKLDTRSILTGQRRDDAGI